MHREALTTFLSDLFLLAWRPPPRPVSLDPSEMLNRPEAEDPTGPASASPAARGHARSWKRGKVCRLPGLPIYK